MSTPYKDLEFSFSQRLILLLLKYFKINKNTVYTNRRYDFLRTYSLVDYHPKNHMYLTLNEKGRMYLRYRRKDNFRFWIPVIISVFALFAGYGVYVNPVIEAVLQAIATLLKTIVENLGAAF